MVRSFTAGAPLSGGSVRVGNLAIRTNVGSTGYLSGGSADPVAEMRFSRDAGRTWSSWRPTTLGQQGQYRQVAEWRALGLFDAPGMLFEFRCSDNVDFRVSGATINERIGGRSR
jgi:hypothetical protein